MTRNPKKERKVKKLTIIVSAAVLVALIATLVVPVFGGIHSTVSASHEEGKTTPQGSFCFEVLDGDGVYRLKCKTILKVNNWTGTCYMSPDYSPVPCGLLRKAKPRVSTNVYATPTPCPPTHYNGWTAGVCP